MSQKERDSTEGRMRLIEMGDYKPASLPKNPFSGLKTPQKPKDPVITSKIVKDRHCSWCGKPMVLRFRKKDGNPFYGCSDFPDCRRTAELDSTDLDDQLEQEEEDRDEDYLRELDF